MLEWMHRSTLSCFKMPGETICTTQSLLCCHKSRDISPSCEGYDCWVILPHSTIIKPREIGHEGRTNTCVLFFFSPPPPEQFRTWALFFLTAKLTSRLRELTGARMPRVCLSCDRSVVCIPLYKRLLVNFLRNMPGYITRENQHR